MSVYEVLFNFLVAKTSDPPFLSAMLYHVLGLVVVVCTVSGQSITITGPSTVTTPTSELRITCTPSTVGISDINSITIRKNSSTLGYQNVVSVTFSKATSDSVLTWYNFISNTRAGVSATGNVNTISGASLVLIIAANRTTCSDGGAYQCNMGVTLTGGSGGVADAEKYVAATEIPTSTNNPLTVFPFPNVDSTYYSVGTTLTITCSGTVGSDRKYHTWCYKRANDFGYTGYPTGADINQNDDNLVQSGCNYIRTSTLTYTVTEADSNTTFLCEPFTGSLCGSNLASLIGYLSIQIFSGQSITITGPSTVTTPTSELRITCTPSTVGISDINSITIRKNSSTLGYQNVVSVTYSKATSDSVLTWGSIISNTRAGVSATGNINTVSGASLVFIIAANWTTCTDGGAYQCVMGVTLTGGSGGVAEAEKYVAVTEIPTSTNNPLTVFPFPNVDSTYYSVGTTLTITCSGTVGSDRKYHTWCYKRANDFGYTGYPTGADINQNDESGCNYIRTSTLTYTVTEADSNTTFLCEPFTGSLCGSNPASLIGYLSIQIYTPVPQNTTPMCEDSGDGVTIWIIIAVVFILATVSLSIIVGYMYHRIREYKEQLHQRMNYEITNRYPRRDEHVYSTTDNYDNINS